MPSWLPESAAFDQPPLRAVAAARAGSIEQIAIDFRRRRFPPAASPHCVISTYARLVCVDVGAALIAITGSREEGRKINRMEFFDARDQSVRNAISACGVFDVGAVIILIWGVRTAFQSLIRTLPCQVRLALSFDVVNCVSKCVRS